ncbi:hypothetical protein MKEN_01207300 [Mycena kentingensis (nom. inval.)]|nr:hypothetical protein MKEN_01207300 [Mycena kentingensis (nom. inval.)]
MPFLSISLALLGLFASRAASSYVPSAPMHRNNYVATQSSKDCDDDASSNFKGTIRWVDCHTRVPASVSANVPITNDTELPSSLKCGEMDVPMDYSKPFDSTTNKITIGLVMIRPENPKGVIYHHAGGPGENAAAIAWSNALNASNEFTSLTDEFDFLAINTRGIEFSNPLNCTSGVFFNDIHYAYPSSESEYKAYVSAMKQFQQSCIDNSTPAGIVKHVGTKEVIQDWDVVRAALGYEKIHFMGVSYGTFVSAAYVARYPKHVGHFAIDAVIPHGFDFQAMLTPQVAAINRLLERADAFCLQDKACPFYGQGKGAVAAAYDEVLARAIKEPIAAPGCGEGTGCVAPVKAADVRFAAHVAFRSDPDFPLFNTAIAQALQGNATLIAYGPALDIRETVVSPLICSDIEVKKELRNFAAFDQLRINAKSVDPHDIRFSQIWQLALVCSAWPYPVPAQSKFKTDIPLLWVTSDYDLNLPTELTTFAWQQTPKSALLIRHGDDHGSLQLVDGDAGTASALAREFIRTGVLPKAQNNTRVTVVSPGGKRGPVPDPYSVPLGAVAGDKSSIEEIV